MEVLGVDRVIIVTGDIDESIAQFSENLDLPFGEIYNESFDTPGGETAVQNAMSVAGIELVTPVDEDSPMGQHIEQNGPGLYAVSFRVTDLEEAIDELAQKGIDPVGGFESGGLREVFLHPGNFSGVMPVLAEYDTPHPSETALSQE
jgi:methylmalonyl-CoA/ethylmalonyl-CoA epimerase